MEHQRARSQCYHQPRAGFATGRLPGVVVNASKRAAGQVRIIAGRWRGSRLVVTDVAGLRPTPDRLRETLFNWLAPALPGARCLDLYAGSGALGLEAASRGAGEVVMVERDAGCVRRLNDAVTRVRAENVHVVRADALDWLRHASGSFDIVFLDPPYTSALLTPSVAVLDQRRLLAESALVYLEQDASTPRTALPDAWGVHRESRAGHALGVLVRVRAALDPALDDDDGSDAPHG